MKFTPAAIEKHIHRKHPGCTDFAVSFFVAEIAKKDWNGATRRGGRHHHAEGASAYPH